MARTTIHPGEHLAEQLQALGISAAGPGRQLRVPTNRITAILNGQRVITGETTLRLAHYLAGRAGAESHAPIRWCGVLEAAF